MVKDPSVLTDISKVDSKIQATGCKFLRLTTLEGSPVVNFNPMGKPWKPRLQEISRKMPSLPDGIYIFQCQDSLSPGAFSHKFYFGKGSFQPLSELPVKTQPVNNNESLLSVKEALDNVKLSSEAIAENSYLKKEVQALREENATLKAKVQALEYLEEEEEELEEEPNPGISWIQETIPALLPLADRFFDLEEKKLALQEKKLNFRSEKKAQKEKLPPIGSPQFNEMVEEISNLSDKDFDTVMRKLQAQAPEHFQAILPLVWGEEEEGSETQEEEEEKEESNA